MTDFSGMAFLEMAIEFMRVQLHRYGVAEPKTNFNRASDIEDRVFAVLNCPQRNRWPSHTIRSVMHRVDATMRQKLTGLVKHVAPYIEQCLQSGMTQKTITEKIGDEWMQTVVQTLQDYTWNRHLKSCCENCSEQLFVHCNEEQSFLLAAAGTTCRSVEQELDEVCLQS